MADGPTIKKKRFDGTEVEILGETYEAGETAQQEKYEWTGKIVQDRERLIRFLETGLRYWYSKDWFGSEKRKNPA